ncbi:MAG TPA: hypothetical protein VM364_11675 [Vicinamibacterales bacterium]|nr:hypothetical protein [Vicinamibacterales bacterium]
MSLRVGIDIDGVLADFRSAFHEAARQCLRRDVEEVVDPKSAAALGDRDVRKVWDFVARVTNWWMELQPYEPDQIARLYELTRAGGWEVFFLTNRPRSAGDSVQFQTQWWLERQGFYLPSVLTVPGSRGDVSNGLRLDVVIDDLVMNCVEIVGGSPAKAILMLRDDQPSVRKHALDRGIGVVSTLAETLEVLVQFDQALPERRGRMLRLAEWFKPAPKADVLPQNPRTLRPLPRRR